MWQSDDGAFSQDVSVAQSGGFTVLNNGKRALILVPRANAYSVCISLCPCAWSLCGLKTEESRGYSGPNSN